MANGKAVGLVVGLTLISGIIVAVVVSSKKKTSPNVTLVSIAVTPASTTLEAGSTLQFTAIGTYTDGSTKDITTDLLWNSSNPSIAIFNITNSGLVTAMTTGTVDISACTPTVMGGRNVSSPDVSLTVTIPVPVTGQGQLKITTNALVLTDNYGNSQSLVAEIYIPEIDLLCVNIDPLNSMDAGDYTLIIGQLHYVPVERHITIRANQTTEISVNLVSTNQFCNLYDTSCFDTWDQLKDYIQANFPGEPVPWPY
jgi:hypothetical protein